VPVWVLVLGLVGTVSLPSESAGLHSVLLSLAVVVPLLNVPGAPDGGSGEPWWWAPQFFFALPSTWPIVVLVLATPWIRGWWSPRRRAQQAR
jgi:hypothetical protein